MNSPPILSEDMLVMNDGARVVLRRLGNPGGPRIVVGHGNGFAVDAFEPMWRHLLDVTEVVPVDLRNHGRNPLHRLQDHRCAVLTDDLTMILAALAVRHGERPTHGLFHSVSGIAALHLATREECGLSSLMLLEPPCQPPRAHPLYPEQSTGQDALAAGALHRRASFGSPGELVDRLAGRPAFSRTRPGALEAYAKAILRRHGDGEWTLACPPAFESQLYADNHDRGLWEALPRVSIPVLIACAASDELRPRLAAALADQGGFDLMRLRGVTHLMPMERPDLLARIALAYFSSGPQRTG